jgi:hypothetical protein
MSVPLSLMVIHKVRAHAHYSGRREIASVCVRTLLDYRAVMQESDPVAAWAGLLRTHAAVVPKLERALAPTGLPLTWYDVLLVTNAAPDRRLRMTELGRQAVVSRERVSRVVSELERAGLVEVGATGRTLVRRLTREDFEETYAARLGLEGLAARVGAAAGPGEVLVSSTVRDLVIGSGLEFEERGERELAGVPGSWRLFMARV